MSCQHETHWRHFRSAVAKYWRIWKIRRCQYRAPRILCSLAATIPSPFCESTDNIMNSITLLSKLSPSVRFREAKIFKFSLNCLRKSHVLKKCFFWKLSPVRIDTIPFLMKDAGNSFVLLEFTPNHLLLDQEDSLHNHVPWNNIVETRIDISVFLACYQSSPLWILEH